MHKKICSKRLNAVQRIYSQLKVWRGDMRKD